MPKQVKIDTTKPETAQHNIAYKTKEGQQKYLILEDKHFNVSEQLDQHYTISKDFIHSTWIHIWNKSLKSYLMYTGDRDIYIKDWQANFHLGLIRKAIDVYISFLEDVPMQFIVNGLSEAAFAIARPGDPLERNRVDFVRDTVNYIAEITRFHEQASMGLVEGMMFWTTPYKTRFQDFSDTTELVLPSFINGEFMDVTYRPKQLSTPITESMDIYHVFPDPYSSTNPGYVIERNIVRMNTFIEIFGGMIMSEDNELKINKEDLLDMLMNKNNADFTDFATLRNEIYQYHNNQFSQSCSLYKSRFDKSRLNTSNTGLNEAQKTDKVEYKFWEYEDRVVLKANNFPVYIGPNKNGKIMFEFVRAYNSRELFTESPALLLSGLEDSQNSFWNNYIDNARVSAHVRYIASRQDFQGTPDIEDLPPGGTLWADRATENTYRPMQTPPVTDHGIMNLADVYSQGLSGVSEIDSGRASNLRVAAEGASLAGATNRRLNGYIKRFMNGTSHVATDWICLFQKHLATQDTAQWAFSRDLDGNTKTFDITAKDLEGSYNVSLDAQGFFAMNKESWLQKKMDAYNTFKDVLTPEQKKRHMQSIYRDMGMNPAIYLPEAEALAPPPLTPSPIDNLYGDATPTEIQGRDIARAMNTQIDLGNEWKWQPF